MSNNNWFIKSISLVETATPPTKQEMEKLLPSSWPAGWEEIKRQSTDGSVGIKIGHLSPGDTSVYPDFVGIDVQRKLHEIADKADYSKYDFISSLMIAFVKDSGSHSFNNNKLTQGVDSEVGKLLEETKKQGMSDEQIAKEIASVQPLLEQAKQFASMVSETQYLGEKARVLSDTSGKFKNIKDRKHRAITSFW